MTRSGEQQIAVLAHYSDGSTEDVTRLAQFEPNDGEMAEVTAHGLVKTLDLTGDVAIMARYQGQVGVFRASVPLGAECRQPAAGEELRRRRGLRQAEDAGRAAVARLRRRDVPAPRVGRHCRPAADAGRSAGVSGRPGSGQARRADRPAARQRRLRRLLRQQVERPCCATTPAESQRHAGHLCLPRLDSRKPVRQQAVRPVRARHSDRVGRRRRESAGRLVSRGEGDQSSRSKTPRSLFLGLRIQCARCHHHPFEKWSQHDYYGFSAFFSQVARKPGEIADELRIFSKRGAGTRHEPEDERKPARRRAWAPSRATCRPSAIRARRWSTGWPIRRQPVLRPRAGQSLLEALLQPRPRRSGRRHAGDESGDESGAARRAGQPLRQLAVSI